MEKGQSVMKHEELRSLVENRKEELIQLCCEMIRIPSVNPPGEMDEMISYLCAYLEKHGIQYEIKKGKETAPNIIARIGQKDGRVLLLNGHCDVVPVGNLEKWDVDPFCGEVRGGKILGRGTSDMKTGLAGLLFVMGLLADNQVALDGEVVLSIVPDEEVSGQFGTKWLVENGVIHGDACLIAEPTGSLNCEIGQKGCCWLKLTASGEPAHGSLAPFAGENAINRLLKVLNRIDTIRDITPRYDDDTAIVMEKSRDMAKKLIQAKGAQHVLNHCTVNLGKISGGTKVNMVPDYAEAEIDIRLPIGVTCEMVEEQVIRILKESEVTGVTYSFCWQSEPNSTSAKEEIVEIVAGHVADIWGEPLARTYQWASSDARFFRYAGIPTLQYGPANLEGIHAYNETVDVQDVINAAKIYICTITDFLNGRK